MTTRTYTIEVSTVVVHTVEIDSNDYRAAVARAEKIAQEHLHELADHYCRSDHDDQLTAFGYEPSEGLITEVD